MFEPQWRHKRRWRRMKQLDSQLAESATQGWPSRRNGMRVPPRQSDEHAVERHEMLQRAKTAVARLTSADRDLITKLFGLDGETMSEAEIANRQGITRQAVCNRKRRALAKLKTLLTEREDNHGPS